MILGLNVAGAIALSVFVIGALILFVPALMDRAPRYRHRRGVYFGPVVNLTLRVLGVWIICLALGLTLGQALLLGLGLFVYQTRVTYQ